MHQNCSDAADGGRLKGPQHRITEQPDAKTPFLVGPVYCEAAEDHHRDRVWHVAPDLTRRLLSGNRAVGESVIADDSASRDDDVGARSAARLVRKRPFFQPLIENGDT